MPSAVPGDCGRCRRPGLGISTTIPSSVCSNPFSRWSSRSTSLAWSNRPSHPEAEVVSENCRELCDCYKFILLGLLSVGFCRRPCARSDVAADPRPRLLRTLNRPPITRGTEGSNPLPSTSESDANLIPVDIILDSRWVIWCGIREILRGNLHGRLLTAQ